MGGKGLRCSKGLCCIDHCESRQSIWPRNHNMLKFYTDWDNQGINELCKSKLELGKFPLHRILYSHSNTPTYLASNRLKKSIIAWFLGETILQSWLVLDIAAFQLNSFEIQISINILLWIETHSHMGIKCIPVLCLGLGTPDISLFLILGDCDNLVMELLSGYQFSLSKTKWHKAKFEIA